MKLFAAICFLFIAARHVECRRHPNREPDYKLFVFGDTFADAGNVQKSELSRASRGWYYPYGTSDSDNDNNPSGRYSNGMVQSDYVAQILGLDASPPPYRLRKANQIDPSGENFAMVGAGVFDSPQGLPTLDHQVVNQFDRLVNLGIIKEDDLEKSVAFVAISAGHDYKYLNDAISYDDMLSLCSNVTNAIGDSVRRLQELGVPKILVNSLAPIGCAPFHTRANNYTRCIADGVADEITKLHNTLLKHNLGDEDGVLLLDINTFFRHLVQAGSTLSTSQNRFKHKLDPCCDNVDSDGYCGQEDDNGNPLYTLCDDPDQYFYWDYMYPTQAGWKAVMDFLEGSIQDFLEIPSK
ncbi:hypothetical protein ACP4OV_030840 [Aristida adscensionis]